MNKKEFEEFIAPKYEDEIRMIGEEKLITIKVNKTWQWIEQYGKQQRIDERQSIIKLIKRIKADKPSIGAKEALRTVLIELREEGVKR